MSIYSIEIIFSSVVIEVFNAFQNYVKEKIFPEMTETFAENGVEVDNETFHQFFKDIDKLPQINKYVNKESSKVVTKKQSSVGTILKQKTETKEKQRKIINDTMEDKHNDNKQSVQDLLAKIKANQLKDKQNEQVTKNKSESDIKKGKILKKEETNIVNNKPDIKALLEKIKAAKLSQHDTSTIQDDDKDE